MQRPVLTSGTVRVRVVVFNATFNNVSVISWQSVKPNKQNENTKQKEKQTKRKQNKIHGEIRKTLLTLNVTDECYS
jgi:hypothetical protein